MTGFGEILTFWFDEAGESRWWKKDAAFDSLIRSRFAGVHRAATRGECYPWRRSAAGRLAEVIVLDQFSRNLYRDRPEAFAWDCAALALAQEAVAAGADGDLTPRERNFFYMPFMHSESAVIHAVAETLFRNNGLGGSLDMEIRHRRIIERFGRYPHRNAILGRQSTPEELEFLNQPGSSF